MRTWALTDTRTLIGTTAIARDWTAEDRGDSGGGPDRRPGGRKGGRGRSPPACRRGMKAFWVEAATQAADDIAELLAGALAAGAVLYASS